MNEPTSNYLRAAGRELHYMDWGPQEGEVVVAWHGLARTGRDMDELAQHFAERGFRVLCPDTIGRGLSQWSPAPDEEYQLSFYARLADAFCTHLGLERLHWVG
ncbi:MAG: alpha/beta fold hydrolase, partial [Variovorax sp.]